MDDKERIKVLEDAVKELQYKLEYLYQWVDKMDDKVNDIMD